jgi:predicted nucleic acid-binding protein
MLKARPKYYWDANLFLAWLINEKRKKGEMEGLAEVAWMVDHNEAVIVTSVITRTEVLESKMSRQAQDLFLALCKRPNVVLIDVNVRIADLAREIRDFYAKRSQRLRVPDATHLATAIAAMVDEFHTFDEDDLISKNGNVAGHNLTICKPRGAQGILFPDIT